MPVLVTGGAGFLGSHLCDALLAEGNKVVAVDNLLTGNIDNVRHLSRDSRFEFCDLDICEPFDCGPVEHVFHFASPAAPADYMVHGITTLRTGSLGTLRALDLARKYGARFLLASASEVYGDPNQHPQHEDYWGNANPVSERSVYTQAKRLSEVAAVAYRRYHNLDTRIVRIFYTYGPRMKIDDGRMVSEFIKNSLFGEDLVIYGDGTHTRSLTYVSDTIEGILRVAHSQEHEPVNIGRSEEITVLECAQLILALTGSHSQIRFSEPLEDDPKRRCPDITKARKLLGWESKVNLPTGLRRTVDYFRTLLSVKLAKEPPIAS
ncbi:MAG TPA: GDP-mannose 4,6-dehydratase [Terriglobales bacterium]|nr:GDP-mannose 4,6-dehydratase [Terriglobales bacterium]